MIILSLSKKGQLDSCLSYTFCFNWKHLQTQLLFGCTIASSTEGCREWKRSKLWGRMPWKATWAKSLLPALGLCDLELEEVGLGCGSRQWVSLLPPSGSESKCTPVEPAGFRSPKAHISIFFSIFHIGGDPSFYSGRQLPSWSLFKRFCNLRRGHAWVQIPFLLYELYILKLATTVFCASPSLSTSWTNNSVCLQSSEPKGEAMCHSKYTVF